MTQAAAKTAVSSYFCLLALYGILTATQLLPDSVQHSLYLDRDAIAKGQWWRLLSGHFVHLSWLHLLFNGLLLGLYQQLYVGLVSGRFGAAATLVAAAGVSLGVLCCSPTIAWYAGFSGITAGLFAASAVATWRRMPLLNAGVLAVLAIKVGGEQLTGERIAVSSWSEIPTAVDAHLYGLISGALWGLAAVAHRNRAR